MRAYIGCRHDAACGSLESILWTWPLETSLRHIAPSVGRGCEPPLHAHFDHVGLILIQQARSSAALLSLWGTCTPLSALWHVIFVAAIMARQWARRLEQ